MEGTNLSKTTLFQGAAPEEVEGMLKVDKNRFVLETACSYQCRACAGSRSTPLPV